MRRFLLAAVMALAPAAAAAEDCLERVEKFAAERGVSTDLPQAKPDSADPAAPPSPPQSPATSELAESGGVLAPPKTGSDMPTVEPPPGGDSNMPTAPEIAPSHDGHTGSVSKQSATDAQIQALLVAARQAAEAGDHQRCHDQLQKAMTIASDNAE